MADVAGAFFRGQQAGQAVQAHKQALEENKIRAMVLKHQLDGLKIEDQIRTRALASQNLQLLHGQPEADLPQEAVTQANLPSTSRAGMMTSPVASMVNNRVRSSMEMQTGESTSDPLAGPTPESIPAPLAQDAAPDTNNLARRTAAVDIPGVPGLGVPGVPVRPQSLEQIRRQQVLAKLNEPRVLGPDQELQVGGNVVARGPKRTVQPTRASIADAAAGGDPVKANELLTPKRATPAPRAPVQKDRLLDGNQATLLFYPDGRVTDLDGTRIDRAATRIKPIPRATPAARNPDVEARQQYDEFTKVYDRKYPRMTAPEAAKAREDLQRDQETVNDPAAKPADKSDAQRRIDTSTLKTYVSPPSFDKWKAMTAAERQRVLSEPNSRIDDAEMQRRSDGGDASSGAKEGETREIPGHPGTEMTFRAGKWIRTK